MKACFADESPTIKRFRPRARGRANTRLRRGAHVTVVVDALSAEQLQVREAGEAASGKGDKADRRRRVAASKARAAAQDASDAKNDTASDAGDTAAETTESSNAAKNSEETK